MHYNHTWWLELDIFFLNRKVTDQNFISVDTSTENIKVPQLLRPFYFHDIIADKAMYKCHVIDKMTTLAKQ